MAKLGLKWANMGLKGGKLWGQMGLLRAQMSQYPVPLACFHTFRLVFQAFWLTSNALSGYPGPLAGVQILPSLLARHPVTLACLPCTLAGLQNLNLALQAIRLASRPSGWPPRSSEKLP